jgi:hypothetical protein
MSASLTQQASSFNESAATSFSCTLTPAAAGDTLIVVASAGSSSSFRLNGTPPFSVSDGVNSYSIVGFSPSAGTLTFSSSTYSSGYVPAGTSAITLSANWAGTSGHYGVVFSDNEWLSCFLTNGSASMTIDNSGTLANNVSLTANYYDGGYEGVVCIAQNVAATSTTVTAQSNTAFYGIWVGDATGVATSGGAYGFITNNQNTAGSQVNTGTLTISQSVLLVGFAYYYTGSITGNTPTSGGAGFTTLANVWSNGTYETAMAQYIDVSTSTAATWTPQTVNSQSFISFGIALNLPGGPGPLMGRRTFSL